MSSDSDYGDLAVSSIFGCFRHAYDDDDDDDLESTKKDACLKTFIRSRK